MGVENTSGDPSTACVLGGRVKSSFDHFDGCTEKVVSNTSRQGWLACSLAIGGHCQRYALAFSIPP